MTSIARGRRIRTIQFNFDNCRALQWRASHLACPLIDAKAGRGIAKVQVMEIASVSWKSGSVVRLLSGGETMKVVGCDSVGSVICRPLDDECHPGIYVPPSLLVAADHGCDDGAPEHSTDMAAENA